MLLYGAFERENGPQIVFLQLWRENAPWRRPCCRCPFMISHIGWGNLFSRLERRRMHRSILRKPCTEWYAASKDSSNRIRSILWILLLRSLENSAKTLMDAEMKRLHRVVLIKKVIKPNQLLRTRRLFYIWTKGELGTHSTQVTLNTVYYYN